MTRTGGRGNPILDGAEAAVAAARVAVISATRSAFHRGLAQTAPRFSPSPSSLVPSKTLTVLPGRLQPCNARRRGALRLPRRYRLTPADRTGCAPAKSSQSRRDGSPEIPYPRTITRRSHDDSHR